ncbi:MAG: complex I subunit 4 family protein [Flavobacteriales bacterium]
MLTIALFAVPILLAGVIFLMGAQNTKKLALGAGIIELILSLIAYQQLQSGTSTLLSFQQIWIEPMGMSIAFNTDGISMALILLAGVLSPLIIYASFNKEFKNAHIFYGLILLMIGAMMGAFVAADALLFYVFYEVALIPIYFIILMWGHGDDKVKVTMRFFLYTLFGSLFMLASLIYVQQHTAPKSFAFDAMYAAGRSLSSTEQGWVFAGIFLAFAVKIPVFPFHSWQPSTYRTAPTIGTMLLAGIMLKMASYGLIRLALPMAPQGIADHGNWAIVLSIVGILYASGMAIVQKNYKLLIAYSSIAHLGLLSAGILSGTEEGIVGGLFEMLSHGIIAVGLFFVVDIIESRLGTLDMSKMGGIREANPLFAFLFFVIVMGSVALPFTSGFVGEFLLLQGLSKYGMIAAGFAGLTVILGAVYMLRAFQMMMLGSQKGEFAPLTQHEKTVLVCVVLLVVILGLYPTPVLNPANLSLQTLFGTIR